MQSQRLEDTEIADFFEEKLDRHTYVNEGLQRTVNLGEDAEFAMKIDCS